jgi:hypothetical protein
MSQILTAVSIFAMTSPSFAADVVPIEGTPLVNSGNGFRPVAGATGLAPGDRVMVSPGGSAKIVYSDKCVVAVLPGRVVAVTPDPPCMFAKGAVKAEPYTVGPEIAVIGVGVGIGICLLANDPLCSPPPASP